MKRILAVVLTFTMGCAVSADDSGPWTLKAGLGYLATGGNIDNQTVSGLFDAGYKVGRWEHTLGLTAMGAEIEGLSTAERYVLAYQTKWDIRPYDYFFGGVDYEKNKFSAVDQSLSETIGYGRRFIDNDRQKLSGEAGVGFRQQDFIDGTEDSGAIVKLAGDYLYNISETSAFTQGITVEIGGDNTTTTSITGLTFKMLDRTNFVLGYTIKNNSDVPDGVKKTDTYSSINLEYTF